MASESSAPHSCVRSMSQVHEMPAHIGKRYGGSTRDGETLCNPAAIAQPRSTRSLTRPCGPPPRAGTRAEVERSKAPVAMTGALC